jgi:hypothetical protein
MSRTVLVMDLSRALAPELVDVLRADMAEQFAAEGCRLPAGPKWTLRHDGRFLAMGGLEPMGASSSMGWFLTGDLRPRDWAMVRRATRTALDWARAHAIRRIHALAPHDRPGATAMLAGMGFEHTGVDDDAVIMTRELF